MEKSVKTIKKAPRGGKQYYKAKETTSEESDNAKNCAEKFQADLGDIHPSFLRIMLPSHVSGGYWLGIPKDFCKDHLTLDRIKMELIDENDVKYTSTLIGESNGLSGGWMAFAREHKLDKGDALVFELTGPHRFKVYIFKAREGKQEDSSDENECDIDTNDGLESARPVKLSKVSPSDDVSVRKAKLSVKPKNLDTVKSKTIRKTASRKAQLDAPKAEPVAKLKCRKRTSSHKAQLDTLKAETVAELKGRKRTSSRKPQEDAPKAAPVAMLKAVKSSSSTTRAKVRKPASEKLFRRKVFPDTRFSFIRRE